MDSFHRLADLEPCLLHHVISWLDGVDSAIAGMASNGSHRAACSASTQNIHDIIQNAGVLLSRWRGRGDAKTVFQDHRDLVIARQHFRQISGRYSHEDADCTLDIEPDGSFRNYGSSHNMVGQATIAAVVPVREAPSGAFEDVPDGMTVRCICKLDRWYTRAEMFGREMSVEELGFVSPGYQTYSVHAWLEPIDSSVESRGAFMENHPSPTPEEGWSLSENSLQHPWPRALTWNELAALRKSELGKHSSQLQPTEA